MSDKLLKVLAWRMISIVITLCVLTAATGNVGSATGITLFLHAFLTVCHFVFEQMWDKSSSRERN